MNLKGKTALVTGASSGIGFETALGLARMGARLIITSSDIARGHKALSDLRSLTGNSAITYFSADLSTRAGCASLCDSVLKEIPALDILVNNAGGYFPTRILTPDGFEMTFALNVLAPFDITARLLPLLSAANGARVVHVSSDAQAAGRVRLDNIMGDKGYSGFGAYSASKLALIMLTREMAARYAGKGITFNAAHPGAVRTRFLSHTSPVFQAVGGFFMKLFSVSAETGAQTSLYLAASPGAADVNGAYYHNTKPLRVNRQADDAALRGALWDLCGSLCGRRDGSI